MAQKAAQARDLRAFVEYAKQNPKSGGVEYASVALMNCFHVDIPALQRLYNGRAASGARQQEQLDRFSAIDRVLQRCGSFVKGELSFGVDPELRRRSIGVDPLVTLRSDLIKRKDRLPDEELGKRILEMRDPIAIATLPLALGVPSPEGPVLYIDEKPFGGLTRLEYLMAESLAWCEFGDECGRDDMEVMTACAQHGLCAADRLSLYRISLDAPASDRIDAMLAVRDRLVEAVREADLSVFKPPTHVPR